MIEQVVTKYDFSKVEWNSQSDSVALGMPFAVSFTAIPSKLQEGVVLGSSALSVRVEDKSEKDADRLVFNRKTQNYFSFKADDGSCRVIEASLFLASDDLPWIVGFPLSLLPEPNSEHTFVILFDGVYYNFICDGEVFDRDMPMGEPSKEAQTFSFSGIEHFGFTNDLTGLQRYKESVYRDVPIAYYTPYGFNSWVGDVVPVVYKGLFHIFYLYDRHHHRSRRGKGAHEFYHLTSSNLIDWVDHGPIQELTEQWQGFGTGTAFVYQGKLHLSFGWHTERTRTEEEMADQLFHRHLKEYGDSGEFDYDQIGTLTPSGASYLTSEDGFAFTPSNKLIHYLKNPSIFPSSDDSLTLYQEGTWRSNHLGGWRLVDESFPPFGRNSFAKNCVDCPNLFSLGGWEYFMIGFTGFWGRKEGTEEWHDFTRDGIDPYDGGAVPMVAEFQGRMIEGSWPNGNGWGSCLLLRELIPLGNGRIGKRWIEETLPRLGEAVSASPEIVLPDDAVYSMIEVMVEPSREKFSVCFTGGDKEVPVAFSIDLVNCRAEWNSSPQTPLLTSREKFLEHPEIDLFSKYPDIHYQGRNYAKEKLTGFDKPFLLRLFVLRDKKLGTTIIDAELGGRHTMLTQRSDLRVRRLSLPDWCKPFLRT